MWFFRAIEFLPRPTFFGLAPQLAMLAVWLLFETRNPTLFGLPVSPLWLALAAFAALHFAQRLPDALAKGRVVTGGRSAAWATVVVAGAALAASAFVTEPRLLQTGWLVGRSIFVFVFLSMLLFYDDGDIAQLPFRWAGEHPFARAALWITAVRFALELTVTSWLMVRSSLVDWVFFVTLGRIAMYYLFEWITILFALSRTDDEDA